MRVLELFSGTGSVGKVCEELGYEVISLDLKNADINTNILDWDYTIFPIGHFDIIWASPPCDTFSKLRKCWYGRKLKCHNEVFSKELELKDREEIGVPILRKTEEIIEYFQPSLWFIENPQTGAMKDYIDKPYYDVDYCKYSDWGYKKPTRIWTNKKDFIPLICDGNCGNMKDGRHKVNMGYSRAVKDGNKIILIKSKILREKYKNYPNILQSIKGGGNSRNERYRIPEKLIKSLLS
jgi:site-specific DNA-cytosine methylase